MGLGVPGRLRPRIISTFGTTPGEISGTHFQRLSRPQGTWFCRKELRKKFPVTPPGIDPGTVRLVAQRLNHYATPDPVIYDNLCGIFVPKATLKKGGFAGYSISTDFNFYRSVIIAHI